MEVRRALPADHSFTPTPSPPVAHESAQPAPHPLAALPQTSAAAPVVQQAPAAQTQTAAQGVKPGGTTPGLSDAQEHQRLTQGLETLKENKTLLKPDQKGPEVLLLQQQLKHLGLHVKETGVLDKSTEGYIKAIQTGGGLGAHVRAVVDDLADDEDHADGEQGEDGLLSAGEAVLVTNESSQVLHLSLLVRGLPAGLRDRLSFPSSRSVPSRFGIRPYSGFLRLLRKTEQYLPRLAPE